MTIEGELLPFHQQELKVGGDGEEDRIFFIWPTTIVHKITPQSPLYMLSAADFLQQKFEIVVVLEGNTYYTPLRHIKPANKNNFTISKLLKFQE